jgi:hypothetical protein
MMKNFFLTILLIGVVFNLKAQDPNWSVDASKYQYSMTFTTFLNVNGTTLSSSKDKVAAIVNGEVRGVANVTYVGSANKYVAYLSVYANTSGEILNFKIYNESDATVYDVSKTKDFVIDGNVGGIFQSYSIASPPLNDEAVLNSFAFSGITAVSSAITNNKIDIVLSANTAITNLITEYTISSGANFFVDSKKQISSTSVNDFTNAITYQLLPENEAVLVEYEVNVTVENENIDIPEIELKSDANLIVNKAPILVSMKTNVAISDFTTEDVSLTNAVVSLINKIDDTNYVLQIVPINQGVFSVEIPKNVIVNIDNEGNSASNKLSFTYDLIRPYILSIKREKPLTEITENDALEFKVVFNEAVKNVFSNAFVSDANATFTIVKETETIYKVTVSNLENATGVVTLNIKTMNTIQDKSGNLLLNSMINVHQN